MTILQMGVPKCGNFWLYQILQKIFKRAGLNTDSFIQKQPIFELAKKWDLNFPEQARIDVLEITDLQYAYRISSIFKMPIEDIENYVMEANHVWTHSPVCKRSKDLFPLFDKKIYIIRDPRDRALSAAKYYTSEYMLKYFPQEEKDPQRFLIRNFKNLMIEWVWHIYDHLRLSYDQNIYIIFYENLLTNFKEELENLLDYLDIHLLNHDKEAINEEVSFSSLKANNPKHLNKGKSGYWREKLTEVQKEQAEIIAGPLLRYLGYENEKGIKPGFSHGSSSIDFENLKNEILQSQAVQYI